jgi:hypothetical protein
MSGLAGHPLAQCSTSDSSYQYPPRSSPLPMPVSPKSAPLYDPVLPNSASVSFIFGSWLSKNPCIATDPLSFGSSQQQAVSFSAPKPSLLLPLPKPPKPRSRSVSQPPKIPADLKLVRVAPKAFRYEAGREMLGLPDLKDKIVLPEVGYLSIRGIPNQKPAPMISLLDGVRDGDNFAPELRELQRRIILGNNELENLTWKDVTEEYKHLIGKGFVPKKVVMASDAKAEKRVYMMKPTDGEPLNSVDACKIEFLTVLANLCGVATPLAFYAQKLKGCEELGAGVFIEWVPNVANLYELTKAGFSFGSLTEDDITYLVISSWFNRFILNYETWTGQFLRSPDGILQIDYDEAFRSVDKFWFEQLMKKENGYRVREGSAEPREITREDCNWISGEFTLNSPIKMDPSSFDNKFSFWPALFKSFLTVNREKFLRAHLRVDAHLKALLQMPDDVLIRAMTPYLQVCRNHGGTKGRVRVSSSDIPVNDFRDQLLARFHRSIGEFGDNILGDLAKAARGKRSGYGRYLRRFEQAIYC